MTDIKTEKEEVSWDEMSGIPNEAGVGGEVKEMQVGTEVKESVQIQGETDQSQMSWMFERMMEQMNEMKMSMLSKMEMSMNDQKSEMKKSLNEQMSEMKMSMDEQKSEMHEMREQMRDVKMSVYESMNEIKEWRSNVNEKVHEINCRIDNQEREQKDTSDEVKVLKLSSNERMSQMEKTCDERVIDMNDWVIRLKSGLASERKWVESKFVEIQEDSKSVVESLEERVIVQEARIKCEVKDRYDVMGNMMSEYMEEMKSAVEGCKQKQEVDGGPNRERMRYVEKRQEELQEMVERMEKSTIFGSRSGQEKVNEVVRVLAEEMRREDIYFTGDNEDTHVCEYLRLLIMKFKSVDRMSEYQKILVTRSGLKCSAKLWAREQEYDSYQNFEEQLLERFWNRREQGSLIEKIYRNRYTGGLPMSVYLQRFIRLASYLTEPMSDVTLAKQMFQHFNFRVRESLVKDYGSTKSMLEMLQVIEAEELFGTNMTGIRYRGKEQESKTNAISVERGRGRGGFRGRGRGYGGGMTNAGTQEEENEIPNEE